MLKLKKVAITGGVASGKSTVCKVFQDLGAFVIDADAIVHELLSLDTDLSQKIIRLLGKDVLENEKLSRRLIADKVFKDPELLHALEKLLHPAVLHKLEESYHSACQNGRKGLFVAEIPLLYEIGQEGSYDAVIAVLASDEKSRERFQRAGHSDQEYDRRMKRQWHPDEKASRANYTINNDGSFEDLRRKAAELYKTLNP